MQKTILLTGESPLRFELTPPGKSGIKRLQADFSVDSRQQLHLTLTDLKNRKAIFSGVLGTDSDHKNPVSKRAQGPSGYEPSLYKSKPKTFGLPFKQLASMLNLRPPEQVSVDAYAAALLSDDSMVRFNAADILARRADREARIVFEDVLRNGAAHQRASVVGHLYRFSWFSAEPLYQHALEDDDDRVREAAIFSLCKMRLPAAYSLVTDILINNNTEAFYSSAVWGLYSRPDPAAVSVLRATLQAENPETRALALEVLGATENVDAITVAKSTLQDENPDVLYAATLSWIELARETCFVELADLIEKTSSVRRQAILRGFFHATNYMGIEVGSATDASSLIKALAAALQDELSETRLSAFLPLCWIRLPEAETTLLEGFDHETDMDIKARMLTFAVHLMSPIAPKLLKESRQSSDILLRQTAEYLSQVQSK